MNQINLPTVTTVIERKFGKNGKGGIAKFARLSDNDKYTQPYLSSFFQLIRNKGMNEDRQKILNEIYNEVLLVDMDKIDPKEISESLRTKINEAIENLGGVEKVADMCSVFISESSIYQILNGNRTTRTNRVDLLLQFLEIKE